MHGVEVDAVTFHEVGAVDSIVDIVAAAQLISLIHADRWTSAPLPIGSGRINSAHGDFTHTCAGHRFAPARPASYSTMAFQASASRQQAPRSLLTSSSPARGQARTCSRMSRTGVGFGARTLPGISNCLRALAFDEATPLARSTVAGSIDRRQLAVITFEVDDQSPEDLAAGLDHIRGLPEVFDVTQTSVVGKKGRMAAHIQVLVSPRELDNVMVACFEETATIGLRYQLTEGAVLRRRVGDD